MGREGGSPYTSLTDCSLIMGCDRVKGVHISPLSNPTIAIREREREWKDGGSQLQAKLFWKHPPLIYWQLCDFIERSWLVFVFIVPPRVAQKAVFLYNSWYNNVWLVKMRAALITIVFFFVLLFFMLEEVISTWTASYLINLIQF